MFLQFVLAFSAYLHVLGTQFSQKFNSQCLVVGIAALSSISASLVFIRGRKWFSRGDNTVGQTIARAGDLWFTIATPPQTQLRKSAKSIPTDRPTVRRLVHGSWSVSVDQDSFTQPLTRTTVNQHVLHVQLDLSSNLQKFSHNVIIPSWTRVQRTQIVQELLATTIRRSADYSFHRLFDPLPSGLRILEQKAESVLSVNRQRFLAMLMLQVLRSFQPFRCFLRLSVHASTKASNT
uniref:Uncharacterized protein n=1 Tax=Solanum tuberosum TaxID=4113 RepID=M1DCR0_SOLTU